ncbi:Multimeric flavodoxin WrbA [Sporobacter termitidis DSM 10068]|uniref:Multimeric flavodoxin WrbA n=1 Tax=Sporobacter termitidis DSM 10068 TaxID=1123282 RepID=A0A1M5X5Z5_9FIRM|nr:flavodoxin family protein [Sporobacter termitidis]SHH95245.1 Multimeric flavodoxin WrbA [Sporobacter termitidis DSM 10068]
MKVLLINGSPHREGCTYTALKEVAGALEKNGVDTEIFQIGTKPVHGCTACQKCSELDRCVFDDDILNEMAARCAEADGIVIGSPVYYSGINGALSALLDRLFYSSGDKLQYKPGAAVVSCRRGGNATAFDRINKYFTITQMPVVSSQYWNGVHGFTPEDVKKDLEGMQIMRRLGTNMAWLLKSIQAGGGPIPLDEPHASTSFPDGL